MRTVTIYVCGAIRPVGHIIFDVQNVTFISQEELASKACYGVAASNRATR